MENLINTSNMNNMNNTSIQSFTNDAFGTVRTISQDNTIWFVAKDVCDCLGIGNSRKALSRLDDDEKADVTLSDTSSNGVTQKRNVSTINEYGLYNLVLSSRKQEARNFKRWVTHDILPSLRKNGGYIVGQESLSEKEIMAKAILYAKNTIKQMQDTIRSRDKHIAILSPKADYFDALVDTKLNTNFRITAKELGVSERKFIDYLLEHRYIYRDSKGNLLPYASAKERGLFVVKEAYNQHSYWTGVQTLVTPKGRQVLLKSPIPL